MREFDGVHAELFESSYSAEQTASFRASFASITEAFKEQQNSGTNPADPMVQALVERHFEFCLQFWKPDRASYKALAQSYLLPTPYRDSYESINSGLAKYHHDAMVIWADKNLS